MMQTAVAVVPGVIELILMLGIGLPTVAVPIVALVFLVLVYQKTSRIERMLLAQEHDEAPPPPAS